jgi:hypothetical protein
MQFLSSGRSSESNNIRFYAEPCFELLHSVHRCLDMVSCKLESACCMYVSPSFFRRLRMCICVTRCMIRVGQNRIYTPYMTVYL